MRIAITGASGFIGKEIIRLLVERKIPVCILNRLDSDARPSQKYPGIHRLNYSSLKDEYLIKELKAWQPTAMIQAAWKGISGNERDKSYHYTHNIPYTLDSVMLASKTGCAQWIGLGSQAEYGNLNHKVDENTFCIPVTAYGKAKLSAGISALGLCETLDLQGTWTRLFSVYGPGDHDSTFISYIIKSFMSKNLPELTLCEQKWDFLYITDTAEAILEILRKNCSGTYNVGQGKTIVLKNVVEILRNQMQIESKIQYGKKSYSQNQVMHLEADITKIVTDTGWKPRTIIEEGLQQTILSNTSEQ